MKNTLFIALLSCLSAIVSNGADLVAEWDGFSSLTSGGYTLSLPSGAGSVNSADGSLHINQVTESGNSNATYTARPTIDISGAGLTLSGGMTVSMLIKGGNNDGNFFSLASSASISNADFYFSAGIGKNDNYHTYAGKPVFNYLGGMSGITGLSNDIAILSTLEAGYGVLTVTMVAGTGENESKSHVVMYLNGEEVASAYTNTQGSDALARLTLGGWSGSSDNGVAAFDMERLAIYSGAMSSGDVVAQYTAWTSTSSVPEPATATLSLLALAGLAARRRRK